MSRTGRLQPSLEQPVSWSGPSARWDTRLVDGCVDVVVADADPAHRARLEAILNGAAGVRLTGQAGHAAGALTQALRLRPGILLLDAGLPDAASITRQIIRHLPATRVLTLSTPEDRTPVAATLDAGALGYLDKTCTLTDVLTIVRAVADEQYWLCPRLAARHAPLTHRLGLAYVRLVA